MKAHVYIILFALLACKPSKNTVRTENINKATLSIVDQAIDSGTSPQTDDAKITITIRPNNLSDLVLNPQSYLELQDYIIQRFESERPELSDGLKLGFSVNISEGTSNNFAQLSSLLDESLIGIENLTQNVDFVEARGQTNMNKPILEIFDRLGISQPTDLERGLTGRNITPGKCNQQIRSAINSKHASILISLSDQKLNKLEMKQVKRCVQLASKNKLRINLLVSTFLGTKA